MALILPNLPLTCIDLGNIHLVQGTRALFDNLLSFPRQPQLETPAERNKVEVGGNNS